MQQPAFHGQHGQRYKIVFRRAVELPRTYKATFVETITNNLLDEDDEPYVEYIHRFSNVERLAVDDMVNENVYVPVAGDLRVRDDEVRPPPREGVTITPIEPVPMPNAAIEAPNSNSNSNSNNNINYGHPSRRRRDRRITRRRRNMAKSRKSWKNFRRSRRA